MEFIELKDYLLLPFFLLIIYIIAINKRNRQYSRKHPLYKYYIPALTVKITGAIALGLVYQYYYNGGDTGLYFINATKVSDFAATDFGSFIDLVFKPVSSTIQLRNNIHWLGDNFAFSESNFFPIRVIAILQLFTFSSYLPCAIIFAAISFTGIWKIYTSFVHMYPDLYKKFAIAFLFMPSVFFWGSGILKDSLCIAALGWLFYGCYLLFMLRIKIVKAVIIILLSISVLLIIKIYIALAFLPSLLFWVFFTYRGMIRSQFLRIMFLPFIILLLLVTVYALVMNLSKTTDRFDINQIVNQAANFNANNMLGSGSVIDLGVTSDMTTAQLISLAPISIATTLFRPFIWEVNSIVMALSALESLYILYLFLLILRSGTFKTILQNPLVAFCLIFSIIFAFAIGFSTSNFGTLVRYKIPAIPFFITALFILIAKNKKPVPSKK